MYKKKSLTPLCEPPKQKEINEETEPNFKSL